MLAASLRPINSLHHTSSLHATFSIIHWTGFIHSHGHQTASHLPPPLHLYQSAVLRNKMCVVHNRYTSSDHTDCIYGLTWGSQDRVLTSGWDGRIIQHTIGSRGVNGSPELEVNGDIGDEEEQPVPNPS